MAAGHKRDLAAQRQREGSRKTQQRGGGEQRGEEGGRRWRAASFPQGLPGCEARPGAHRGPGRGAGRLLHDAKLNTGSNEEKRQAVKIGEQAEKRSEMGGGGRLGPPGTRRRRPRERGEAPGAAAAAHPAETPDDLRQLPRTPPARQVEVEGLPAERPGAGRARHGALAGRRRRRLNSHPAPNGGAATAAAQGHAAPREGGAGRSPLLGGRNGALGAAGARSQAPASRPAGYRRSLSAGTEEPIP